MSGSARFEAVLSAVLNISVAIMLLMSAGAASSEQGACEGRMEYEYLDEGITLYSTYAVWDRPKGEGNFKKWGTSYAVSFPSQISGHDFLWAQVFFGKKRGEPIFETALRVFHLPDDEKLTGKFTTSLEDEPFYVRVEYMVECSVIILEQRFDP